jgi:hypothetical protein
MIWPWHPLITLIWILDFLQARRCRITALEAVNPEKNDFIYFCASVERFGYHEFAATLKEHNVNAKKIRIGLLPKA